VLVVVVVVVVVVSHLNPVQYT